MDETVANVRQGEASFAFSHSLSCLSVAHLIGQLTARLPRDMITLRTAKILTARSIRSETRTLLCWETVKERIVGVQCSITRRHSPKGKTGMDIKRQGREGWMDGKRYRVGGWSRGNGASSSSSSSSTELLFQRCITSCALYGR